jgi:alkaline phosphatase
MAKNTIVMIGDGMGWEMARAAAIYKQIQAGKAGTTLADFYTSGAGTGLNMQTLTGYAIATTYATTVPVPVLGADGKFTPGDVYSNGQPAILGNTALPTYDATGKVINPGTVTNQTYPDLPGFVFNPAFNPGTTVTGGAKVSTGAVGNLVGYDPVKGGALPWLTGTDSGYIKNSYPDSANTATTLYTGVKTYNGAVGVDIFENPLQGVLAKAAERGKSTGLVTSVPIDHATPAAAAANVNNRNKYDGPTIDYILQQELRTYQPTVLLGGGHPLSFPADPLPVGVEPNTDNTYVTKATYDKLTANPNANEYGYTFLERGDSAATKLAAAAASIDPTKGGRLLGLYGARGQNGNLPVSSANGDYSTTGLDMFSLYANQGNDDKALIGTTINGVKIPGIVDRIRPLKVDKATGNVIETDAQFIATERNQNPTLDDLTKAALSVLGKDPDGLWLMVEGGDIDWSAHDNNLDNLIGTVLDFDKSVGSVIDWISKNGGWAENELIVTADHDHYLTLNGDFPTIVRNAKDVNGISTLTENDTIAGSGQQWGNSATNKYDWGNHSNRPVPVYYQGAGSEQLAASIGTGFTQYGTQVQGIPGLIDQTHIAQNMFASVAGVALNKNLFKTDSTYKGFGVNAVSQKAGGKVSEIGLFAVDDATGKIGGVAPGAAGYLKLAMDSAKSIFATLDGSFFSTGKREIALDPNKTYQFFEVQDGSIAEAQQQIASGKTPTNLLFALPDASGNSSFKVTTNSTNDGYKVSVNNDELVLAVSKLAGANPITVIGAKSQGLAQGRVIDLSDAAYVGKTLKADITTKSDAAYNNTVGFYVVEDALLGTIKTATGILKPGDANYAAEAIKSAILSANKTDSKLNQDLSGGKIYAPVVVAQGTLADFTNKNSTNGGDGNQIHAYFNYLGANPDKLDHFRLIGNNTFGVEDFYGGGDRDFNDLVINLNAKTV